jgi:hypothetical protein
MLKQKGLRVGKVKGAAANAVVGAATRLQGLQMQGVSVTYLTAQATSRNQSSPPNESWVALRLSDFADNWMHFDSGVR